MCRSACVQVFGIAGLEFVCVLDTTGVSTGFRAPTPGQQNTINVQTTLNEQLELTDSASAAGSEVARSLEETNHRRSVEDPVLELTTGLWK